MPTIKNFCHFARKAVRLWNQKMTDGVIEFDDPRTIQIKRTAKEYGDKYQFKKFEEGVNFKVELV